MIKGVKGVQKARGMWNVVAGFGLLAAGLTGCVNQGSHDRLFEANKSLSATNADLEMKLKECQLASGQMSGSIGRNEGTLGMLQKENADLRSQLEKSLADLRGLDTRIQGIAIGPLDADTTRQLENLEQQFPGIISFDADRGLLRVSSDFTFDSGQATVKESAKQALSALSNVLKGGAATQYDLIVEGHTDSQKIANEATRKMHPTNRYLSTHRAIAVIDTLQGMGISSDRMLAAGWGEYRPRVANSANGNTRENRRVEIYLAKSSANTGGTNYPTQNTKATPTPANTNRSSGVDMTK